MSTKVVVGGISWDATDQDLNELFSEVGEVSEAVILQDRETGRSRGFGFVTFSSDSDAQSAIEKYNGHEFQGRPLTVNGDGTVSRDFTYITNVVEANMCAVEAEGLGGEVFNVACGASYYCITT